MPRRGSPIVRRSQVLFRVIRFTRTVRGGEQMIRYVAFRSKDVVDKEKGCFDREHDHANIKSFVRQLEDPLTRHPKAAKAYHCVFSLRRAEFDRLGLKDWRQIVRDAMETYERETGRKLEWIAANHDNQTHPHCHVIIKSAYELQDGQRKQLRLDRFDLKKFREVADQQLDRYRDKHRDLERADGQPEVDRWNRAAGSLFATLQQMIFEEQRRRRDSDRAHQRWLWAEEEREH